MLIKIGCRAIRIIMGHDDIPKQSEECVEEGLQRLFESIIIFISYKVLQMIRISYRFRNERKIDSCPNIIFYLQYRII